MVQAVSVCDCSHVTGDGPHASWCLKLRQDEPQRDRWKEPMTDSGRMNDARHCIRAHVDLFFADTLDRHSFGMVEADELADKITRALQREGRLS